MTTTLQKIKNHFQEQQDLKILSRAYKVNLKKFAKENNIPSTTIKDYLNLIYVLNHNYGLLTSSDIVYNTNNLYSYLLHNNYNLDYYITRNVIKLSSIINKQHTKQQQLERI